MVLIVFTCFFKHNNNILIIVCSAILSVTYGLRVGIGNDYEQYNNIFNAINYNSYSAIEPTFILLSRLLEQYDYGFNYLMAIYAFVTFFLCYMGIRKYNIYPYVPLLMFSTGFIFFVDNQVRQALATSFFIYYMRFISTREFGKYLICVIISTIFMHFSSAVLLLAYFVTRKRINGVVWILLLLFAYILMKLDVVHTVLSNIISMVPYYSELYLQRFNDISLNVTGSGLGVLFWLIIAVFIVIFNQKNDDVIVFNLFIIGTIINTIFINYDIFERVSFYFIYLRFILLAIIFKKIMFRNNVNFMLCGILITLTVFFTSYEVINDANKHGVVPLRFIYLDTEV